MVFGMFVDHDLVSFGLLVFPMVLALYVGLLTCLDPSKVDLRRGACPEEEIEVRFEVAEKEIEVRTEVAEKEIEVRFEVAEKEIEVRFEVAEKEIEVRFEVAEKQIEVR